jgi:hypothetical protein
VGGSEGLTVWVADEAYNGREVKVWHSETPGGVPNTRVDRFAFLRAEARALADRLNSEGDDG